MNFLPKLTGCFAQPVAENPTVVMVEAAYKHHGLHYRYINCEVSPQNLKDAVQGARAMGWVGFNCSLPHKVAVIEYLDELGQSAQLIGAVNTVVRKKDKWIGENTDGKGFVMGLKEVIDPADKVITLFGAGGAARAVAVELALGGVKQIYLVNRNRDRALPLVELLNEHTNSHAEYHAWDQRYTIIPNTDIVVNATSVGLYPNIDEQLNIDMDSIQPHMVMADGIPNPPYTHLLKTAAAKGCRTVTGLKMLVNQGVLGIKYWTGVDVDASVMNRALEEVFGI